MSTEDSTGAPLPEPQRPNESGSTPCLVRWMVDMPDGLWLGAHDREAFEAYGRAYAAAGVARHQERLMHAIMEVHAQTASAEQRDALLGVVKAIRSLHSGTILDNHHK